MLVHAFSATLLRVVDHPSRRSLRVVECVGARSYHATHVHNAGHEALRAWIRRGESLYWQLGSVVVVDHAVHFLGDQVGCWSPLSISLPGSSRIALGGLRITWRLARLGAREARGVVPSRHVTAVTLTVIVSLLLRLHCLVWLAIESLLWWLLLLLGLVSVGLEGRRVDSAFGDLGEWCSGGPLRWVGSVPRVRLRRESVRHLQRVLLVESLLIRLLGCVIK